jgi:hypothetical protein
MRVSARFCFARFFCSFFRRLRPLPLPPPGTAAAAASAPASGDNVEPTLTPWPAPPSSPALPQGSFSPPPLRCAAAVEAAAAAAAADADDDDALAAAASLSAFRTPSSPPLVARSTVVTCPSACMAALTCASADWPGWADSAFPHRFFLTDLLSS